MLTDIVVKAESKVVSTVINATAEQLDKAARHKDSFEAMDDGRRRHSMIMAKSSHTKSKKEIQQQFSVLAEGCASDGHTHELQTWLLAARQCLKDIAICGFGLLPRFRAACQGGLPFLEVGPRGGMWVCS